MTTYNHETVAFIQSRVASVKCLALGLQMGAIGSDKADEVHEIIQEGLDGALKALAGDLIVERRA